MPGAQGNPGGEIAQTVGCGLAVAVGGVRRGCQGTGGGRAAGYLSDADMRLTRANLICDAYARQVGLHQFGAQSCVEMQDRGPGRPARPQAAAPAQLQCPDRSVVRPLVHQFGSGRIMAILQRLGEDPRHCQGREGYRPLRQPDAATGLPLTGRARAPGNLARPAVSFDD